MGTFKYNFFIISFPAVYGVHAFAGIHAVACIHAIAGVSSCCWCHRCCWCFSIKGIVHCLASLISMAPDVDSVPAVGGAISVSVSNLLASLKVSVTFVVCTQDSLSALTLLENYLTDLFCLIWEYQNILGN